MIHSELGMAEFVLKGIAKIDGELKKPDPVTAEKCKEIAKIDDEFKKELGKLVNIDNKSIAKNNCIHSVHGS